MEFKNNRLTKKELDYYYGLHFRERKYIQKQIDQAKKDKKNIITLKLYDMYLINEYYFNDLGYDVYNDDSSLIKIGNILKVT